MYLTWNVHFVNEEHSRIRTSFYQRIFLSSYQVFGFISKVQSKGLANIKVVFNLFVAGCQHVGSFCGIHCIKHNFITILSKFIILHLAFKIQMLRTQKSGKFHKHKNIRFNMNSFQFLIVQIFNFEFRQ